MPPSTRVIPLIPIFGPYYPQNARGSPVLTFFPTFHLHPLPVMANEGDTSHYMCISLEQTHEMRRDRAILQLQEPVRKLTREIE